MAFANYFKAVQEIYIAYYHRPADPAGLRYWAERVDAAGGDITTIINAFAASAEATSLYGDVSKDGVGKVIDKIYLALFGRNPDDEGKAFFEAAFADGTVSAGNIAIVILNAAGEKDAAAVENKVLVADTFTQLVAGREFSDPAFGTDKKFAFDYAGNDAAAAARQLLAKVTTKADTVLDKEAVKVELEGPKTGGGGGAPSIKVFTVADAIAAHEAHTLPAIYKLGDTFAHLKADNAATLLEGAHSYTLTDLAGSLGTLTSKEIALVKGAVNHQLYSYGQFLTLTEYIGTSGDDTLDAPAGSLYQYKLIDGAAGTDVLKIDSSGSLASFIPDSVTITNIETIIFNNQISVWDHINAGRFDTDTAIWQQNLDVDVINLSSGQTAGFSGTDGNVLVSYLDGAESASIAIKGLASATNNSFVISGDDLKTLSVSGSMSSDLTTSNDPILRLHAETGIESGNAPKYVPTENIETLNLAVTTNIKLDLTGNFTSLKTLDASESTGGISIKLYAQPGGLLQSGTIGLGAGDDHLDFQSHNANHLGNMRPNADITSLVAEPFEDLMLSITDFDGQHDVLKFWPEFLQGGGQGLTNDQKNAISGADSLYDAVLLADQAIAGMTSFQSGSIAPQWTTFQYDDSTYIYQSNGDGIVGYTSASGATADGLIELVGFTGALTEQNFITNVQYG